MMRHRSLLSLALLISVLPLLACGASGVVVGSSPRWACPSPLPKPWGTAGPVKAMRQVVLGTATPTGNLVTLEQPVYYEEWEQEYAVLGGPPFPSPTPYARMGTHYMLGQRVEVGPLHVLVDARAGQLIADNGMPAAQLYLITITWVNRSLEALPIDYGQHVRLRAITDHTGAVVSDGRWGVSALALLLADMETLPTAIPPGTSTVTLPILAPPGDPETVEIAFAGVPGFFPTMPSATTLAGTPTATTVALTPSPTPLPNADLRASDNSPLLVQWTAATWQAPGGPACTEAGTLTDWSSNKDAVWGVDAPIAGVAAPPGAARVVQIALNQVGKRYVWGDKGPETFDCSGLMTWSYAQIGLRIPQGTAGQWPHMTAVDSSAIQPGDLVFFDIDRNGQIDHVGMLVGDLNGNGQWDMVHAASPKLGVRMDYDIFQSAYYRARMVGFRTARS